MHRTYTFYNIELQVGMRDAEKFKQFEKWLVDKFTCNSEFVLK